MIGYYIYFTSGKGEGLGKEPGGGAARGEEDPRRDRGGGRQGGAEPGGDEEAGAKLPSSYSEQLCIVVDDYNVLFSFINIFC